MKVFLTKHLLETQLWVSGMITCLCLFFGILYNTVDYYRTGIVFFSTLAGYNYMYFHKHWVKYSKKKLNLIIFIVSIVALLFLVILERDLKLIFQLLFLSLWVLLYNSYFILLKIRNILLVKIFIIAIIWTCVVFVIGNKIIPSPTMWLSVLLFIIGITIPFDIVDATKDVIQTIPRIIGVRCSKYLSVIFLAISYLLFYNNFSYRSGFLFAWGITNLFAVFLVLFMPEKNTYFYTRFWVELCSATPLVTYFIVQK